MDKGRGAGPVVVADVVVSVVEVEEDVSCRGKMAPKAVLLESAMKTSA